VPFEKFMDLCYYSESELCGGAVTVSFSKYLPWQAIHFLTTLHPLLENVLQTTYRKLQEDSGTGDFDVRVSVSKALPPLENRSSYHCIVSTDLMDEL
jgi:hypothetical protein